MTPFRLLRFACVASAIVTAMSLIGEPSLAAPAPTVTAAGLVGQYEGHQMEMAAGLELRAGGRFQYGLAYGALDEQAAGAWVLDGSRVLLTSDPVVAPKFVLLAAKQLAGRTLRLTLDVPQGMNRQYFKARVRLADGRSIERQFADDGLEIDLEPGERPVSVALMLPVYGLAGEAAALPTGGGVEAHFRFDPNDLGKVAFDREPLAVGPDGGLTLERYDRTIVFRRGAAY